MVRGGGRLDHHLHPGGAMTQVTERRSGFLWRWESNHDIFPRLTKT